MRIRSFSASALLFGLATAAVLPARDFFSSPATLSTGAPSVISPTVTTVTPLIIITTLNPITAPSGCTISSTSSTSSSTSSTTTTTPSATPTPVCAGGWDSSINCFVGCNQELWNTGDGDPIPFHFDNMHDCAAVCNGNAFCKAVKYVEATGTCIRFDNAGSGFFSSPGNDFAYCNTQIPED